MQKLLLPFACAFFLVGSVCAQDCGPEATFKPSSKSPILGVLFQNAALISPEAQQEIMNAATERQIVGEWSPARISGLADEAAERTRAAYQNEGYFKVVVTAQAVRVASDPLGRYNLSVRVAHPGRQYRLGEIHISNAAVFSEVTLRDLFPIQSGEIFSREKVAKGLEEIRRLYDSQGYINYTGMPGTNIDDASHIIDLELNVDEGKQYRVGVIDVLGVDPESRAHVLDALAVKSGDIYTAASWQRSALKFHGAALDQSLTGIDRALNHQDQTVDVMLDFRRPQPGVIDLSNASVITIRESATSPFDPR